MTTTSESAGKTRGLRTGVQKVGTFLSGMVMPNIAAFIAWGLITALFIPEGYLPNEQISSMVAPMLYFLLPLLIASTGGRIIHGARGSVVATIATTGVIMSSIGDPMFDGGSPMFLGAMVMAPLAAWLMKQLDRLWDGKVKAGFEMLVNNFSAGIFGAIMAVVGFFAVGPVIRTITDWLGAGVNALLDAGLLPLASIIVEPAKVLFLNNAINHGVLTPLASSQAAEQGRSLLYLVEANPGPGLGMLIAFTVFGLGAARATAPGAIVIQFLGGIHEIYFPYVLAKPVLLLGLIAGGATGIATNVIFGSGLSGAASPGSIIAVLTMTAPGSHLGVILSVVLSALVSFLVCGAILAASRKRDLASGNAGDLSAAVAATSANKGKESSVLGTLNTSAAAPAGAPAAGVVAEPAVDRAEAHRRVEKVIFACDAGMGSSAMGASVLRNMVTKAGIEGVSVTNAAIANLDGTADLIVTQRELTDRARQKDPTAQHVSVDNFMNSPRYTEIVEQLRAQG
ncbi:PTS mannitol transporter subunit IICB [Mycetocola reblochoni]|uniref:PTS system mannitol-specific EIICB component n=2 Tax=Mycetocola reblochoni TaxID=331618 RepID=A0A1R4I8V0_9MICO|nr:PTS mannitol transporter subunit IICB [Mycetocola reblochoni]RLP69167.1 PTS mannitol transporter subunit IICB [Mycetocola reblochoni]SJN16257.1 PTS system, mannitol-specific IIB component / PTS system, mannitol-specific IIC component [Mycetocola reblochoni REB411]